jgi:hypothetical protein
MKLMVHIAGASRLELRRGIDAAQQVFNRSGVSAEMAIGLMRKRDFAIDPLTPWERRHASLWEEAERAALMACCQGWTIDRIPSDAGLEPLFEGDHSETAECMRAIYREN